MAIEPKQTIFESIRCSYCKRRPATKLCDAPIGHSSYVGHPPRSEMEKAKRWDTAFHKVEMIKTLTCDRPICDQCATEIHPGIDYCPICMEGIRTKPIRYKRSLRI